MVEEVSRKANFSPVPDVMADFDMVPGNAAATISVDGKKNGVFVNPYYAEIVPLEWQAGPLAHEVGHLVLGHPADKVRFMAAYPEKDADGKPFADQEEMAQSLPEERRKELKKFLWDQEFAADAFAKKLGYGESLALSLEGEIGLGIPDKEHDASISHPSVSARVKRLRKAA
jgi:hypothetical protein